MNVTLNPYYMDYTRLTQVGRISLKKRACLWKQNFALVFQLLACEREKYRPYRRT